MSASDAPAICCTALTKRYGPGTPALDDLTLTISSGSGFGLLGENGADIVALLLAALYVVAILAFASWRLSRRDLLAR